MNSAATVLVFRSPLPHEEVALRARQLWEKKGRPEGQDMDIWLEAERSLQLEAPVIPSAPVAKSLLGALPSPAPTPHVVQATATAKIPTLRASKNKGRDF